MLPLVLVPRVSLASLQIAQFLARLAGGEEGKKPAPAHLRGPDRTRSPPVPTSHPQQLWLSSPEAAGQRLSPKHLPGRAAGRLLGQGGKGSQGQDQVQTP